MMLRSQKELLAQTQPDLSTHKKTYPEYANGMNKLLVPSVKREISDAISWTRTGTVLVERYPWEPKRGGFPLHERRRKAMAAMSELTASISRRG